MVSRAQPRPTDQKLQDTGPVGIFKSFLDDSDALQGLRITDIEKVDNLVV